ncbi:MAG: 4Fe-4S dicluster domain-containing protein [Saccharospirillaceae bacterium]|nr:4Fe-4S dicluster domain-containing protein [Saccharospirillaceae bacterium]
MMGFALPGLELPVTKTSNCLLAPTEKELPPNDIAMACIRCGMCADACPAELLPQQLYWFSKSQEFDKAEQHNIFDCIECGACSYVCPSHIPLVQYYRYAKGAIREERAAQAKAERARLRFEERLARQEREVAEKEAKRKARAEAAAKAQAAKPAVAADSAAAANMADSNAASDSNAELEKLQKQFDAAQSALAKTKEKLEAARADESMADKLPLFESALNKTQDKIKDLAKQLAAAKKAAKAAPAATSAATDTDKGDPNSPERLKRKWETAQARLDTALKRLAEAKEQGLDTVDALQTGVDKQQERVNEAKAAYDASVADGAAAGATVDGSSASQATGAQTADNNAADQAANIEALNKKILAQQDRVAKMQERLDMAKAEGLDTVDALTLGVQKQQDKLLQLQQELAALAPAGTTSNEAS